MYAKLLSHVQLFVTPWTVAHQVPLFVGFSRQEYWCGLRFSSPGIFPAQTLNPHLLDSHIAGGFFTTGPPGKLLEDKT